MPGTILSTFHMFHYHPPLLFATDPRGGLMTLPQASCSLSWKPACSETYRDTGAWGRAWKRTFMSSCCWESPVLPCPGRNPCVLPVNPPGTEATCAIAYHPQIPNSHVCTPGNLPQSCLPWLLFPSLMPFPDHHAQSLSHPKAWFRGCPLFKASLGTSAEIGLSLL